MPSKFANSFESHPYAADLGSILEEGYAVGIVDEKVYCLYKTELRKFETRFLRIHGEKIEHKVFSTFLSSEASIEICCGDFAKYNSQLLRDFGVSTEFKI
jgi:hypothetical protein